VIVYVLTVLIIPIFLYALRSWSVSRFIAILLYIAGSVAIIFVWIPSIAEIAATIMGVGRGVDMVIYVYCLLSFILILDLSLKIKHQQRIITKLAREIAILNTKMPESLKIGLSQTSTKKYTTPRN